MHERGRGEVFISHTHSDTELARALHAALDDLFGRGRLLVHYSTSKEEGGVPAGAGWFQWIVDRVRRSDLAFVLLTPASIQKPWIPWEAGAVYGAALSRDADSGDAASVLPLRFQISDAELPAPFRQLQVEAGDRGEAASKVFESLLIRFKDMQPDAEYARALRKLDETVARYTARVVRALATAPLTPTEAAVQEWCGRLDDLRSQRRFSETKQVHGWLELAFGRGSDERPRPLDLRIHRRLGELYLDTKDHPRAAEQFALCRKVAPRDLFILRSLGQAYLAYDGDAARRVIDDIAALDPNAFEENAESAALKGRWLRDNDRLNEARDVYARALDRNPASYYLAGRLAQTKLELGEPDAREAYEHVLRIIEGLDEQNVWTHADAANAAVAAGRHEDAVAQLRAIAALGPSRGEIEAIQRGLRELLESLGADATAFAELRAALANAA